MTGPPTPPAPVSGRILVVDDDETLRLTLASLLGAVGHSTRTAKDAASAMILIEEEPFDLVVTDLKMPEADGVMNENAGQALIRYVASNHPGTPVVVISGRQTSQSAAEAMKAGAVDYIDKPFDRRQVTERIRAVLERPRERARLADATRASLPERLSAHSAAMQSVVETITRVASLEVPVLISGPPGSGKEETARAIHASSPRAAGRFIAFRCGGTQGDLVEDDLCGHERGSFSGADRVRRGLLEEAAGGTLLLDGIDELPLKTQGLLVSILEHREFRRLGGSRQLPLTARILATTTAPLKKLVREERFRSDLFYALRVVQIELPALADRRDDLTALTERFLAAVSLELGRTLHLSPEAAALLAAHPFPGNVRELRNVIHAAASLCEGDVVDAAQIGEVLGWKDGSIAPAPARHSMQQAEKIRIADALRRHPGDLTAAAKELGFSRQTLWRRMKHYDLSR